MTELKLTRRTPEERADYWEKNYHGAMSEVNVLRAELEKYISFVSYITFVFDDVEVNVSYPRSMAEKIEIKYKALRAELEKAYSEIENLKKREDLIRRANLRFVTSIFPTNLTYDNDDTVIEYVNEKYRELEQAKTKIAELENMLHETIDCPETKFVPDDEEL